MAVPLDIVRHWVQPTVDGILGQGAPSPADAVAAARFRPDAPWTWCPWCGGRCARSGSDIGSVAAGRPACVSRPSTGCHDAGPGRSPVVVRLAAHRGPVRRWVIDVKHAKWEPMGQLLGALLGEQLLRCGVVAAGCPGSWIVPVPMPWARRASRGIDHAAVVAAAVARATALPMVRALRHLGGRAQVEAADRPSRARGARGRFGVRRSVRRCAAGHVVLIDDVRTTGATLADCARVLELAGVARVDTAVLTVRE